MVERRRRGRLSKGKREKERKVEEYVLRLKGN